MAITSDWHIHSHNSCDEASLLVAELVRDAGTLGIADFGLTDHLHTPFNLPEVEASRREYLAANPSPWFHFGVEVSCVSRWELDEIAAGNGGDSPGYGIRRGGPAGAPPAIGLTEDDCTRLGVEFVVGGTHWPLYVEFERDAVIRDYHRQNMFLAVHPRVDIVAHPWWWMGHWRDDDGKYRTQPWLDDFSRIPSSFHDEFAAALKQQDTAAEINLSAMLLTDRYEERFKRQYLEYLAYLSGEGVALAIGSDCHDRRYADLDFDAAASMLDTVGIDPETCWRLPPRTRVETTAQRHSATESGRERLARPAAEQCFTTPRPSTTRRRITFPRGNRP